MNLDQLETHMAAATGEQVERALARELLDEGDIAALLSPAAAPYLEDMARRAQGLTRQRFGRIMQLYAPLYLSNECVNRCRYCGFAQNLAIARVTLDLDAARAEAERVHAQGFRHLLLVAGEAPRTVDVVYLETIARELRPHFDSLSIEVGTFSLAEYQRLVAAGIDGLTLYQETYQPDIYRSVHPAGPKHDFARRLRAIENGGTTGFRTLGIGALLGLAPWRLDAFALAQHGRALAQRFWRSRIAVSFPRIRSHAGLRPPAHPVSDRELVHMICVLRLALPDAELVLSTREPARLRDHLMGIGITRMSAGSKTNPGGYGREQESGEQFAIEDTRTPAQLSQVLLDRGFEPVWKDFDGGFLATCATSQMR
jgi:2-iminoacetate synthase